MKKISNIFLGLIVFALSVNLLITACTKSTDTTQIDLEKLMEKLYEEEKYMEEPAELFDADVLLKQVTKSEYGVFIIEDNIAQSTGKVFLFQSESLGREKNTILRGAKILRIQNAVLIKHEAGNHLFYVGNKNKLLERIVFEREISGFGFGEHQNKAYWQEVVSESIENKILERAAGTSDPLPDGPLEEEPEEKPNCNCKASGSVVKGCDSGGEGSSTCEVSRTVTVMGNTVTNGCKVTCGAGYFACCAQDL
jgi:hypothetical protein